MERNVLAEMMADSASGLCSYIEDMQFATEPPMGVSVTEVSACDVKDGYAVLHLQSLIHDTGSLMLQVDTELFSGDEAGLTRYDEVSRTIVAYPDPGVLSMMSIGHPRVRVLSDMKFLLRATASFLERHAQDIGPPGRLLPVGEPVFPDGSEPS